MADTVQFVDKIDASPTVALDLNDGTTWRTLAQVDMSPPALRRSVAGTLLRDGSLIPASAYDNRVLGLTLRVSATSEANLATELTKLHRELDKAKNIIKYQRDGGAAPVFFRTFRSPDYTLDSSAPDPIAKVGVSIIAEPFAYGLRLHPAVDITVNNDPAGAGGIRFDVTGIVGDVPSPAVIVANGDSNLSIFYLATRRHGAPANFDEDHQCEAMTQETDTTTQPNNALYSGGGNNFSRTTFATASMATRLSATIPGGANGPDKRGTYRVFLRYLMTVSTDLIDVQMRLGGDVGPATEKVRLKAHGGNILNLADLGLIQIPAVDPKQVGYNSEDASVGNIVISFQAERVSGSGNLDWDYVVLLPADEEFSITDFIATLDGNIDSQIWDGPNDMVYVGVESLVTVGAGALDGKPRPPARVGSLPLLSPNQTNRIYVLHTRAVDGKDNRRAESHTFDVYYWPRFLYIR